ncbi:MAG: hypothetical protein ABR498_10235 [Candidatus Dormibacteria bacterium]
MTELQTTPPASEHTRARAWLIALGVLVVVVVVAGVLLFRLGNGGGHTNSGSTQSAPGSAQPMPTSAQSPGNATMPP